MRASLRSPDGTPWALGCVRLAALGPHRAEECLSSRAQFILAGMELRRGAYRSIEVGMGDYPTPPSEPDVRISRIRLSG